MKEEKQNGLSQSNTSIISVLFNLDTQSAITAALFVSLFTLAGSFFIDLCNYVYWYGYFERFHIPMAYFEEAIIPDLGFLYIVAICVPMPLLWWWGLHKLGVLVDKWITAKPVEEGKRRRRETWASILYIVILLALVVLEIFLLEIVPEGVPYLLTVLLILETTMFIILKYVKLDFGSNYKLSEKSYWIIRILAVLFLLYVILGAVYFSGQRDNYDEVVGQSLKIVNEPQINMSEMKNGEEIVIDLVLLETSDYYYVSQATLRITDDALYIQVWDEDTYRFINKANCPVKSIYAQLSDSDSVTNAQSLLLVLYLVVSMLCGIIFMYLFTLPKTENGSEGTLRGKILQ